MRHDFYDCEKGLDVHLSQCVMPLPLLLPCFFIFKIASAPLSFEFLLVTALTVMLLFRLNTHPNLKYY